MRCKVGDLAVIVRSSTELSAPNIGAVVSVEHRSHHSSGLPAWRVRTQGRLLHGSKYGAGSAWEQKDVPDAWLRPLRPDAGEDETLSWCSVPRTERDSIPAEALGQMKKEEV